MAWAVAAVPLDWAAERVPRATRRVLLMARPQNRRVPMIRWMRVRPPASSGLESSAGDGAGDVVPFESDAAIH